MNETSSRSHSVVQFTISQIFDSLERRDIESVVSLVDLAGSERQGKTDATGQQFEEAKKINQSLLMLGRALNSFSDGKGDTFVSLRESKLTRLLSESFGGNSKTWMLATVSPAQFNVTESLSTLEYAQNALCITNRAEVNRKSKSLEASELKNVIAILEKRIEEALGHLTELGDLTAGLESEESKLLELIAANSRSAAISADVLAESKIIEASCTALRDEITRVESTFATNEASSSYFVGHAGISLRSIMKGEKRTFVLPLRSSQANDINSNAVLHIQMFPVELQGAAERSESCSLRFCLNVVGASDLPRAGKAFCKYSLRFDQDERWYRTPTATATASPVWNFVKQFDLLDLSDEVVECFCVENVFVFEVYAFD